MKRLALVCTLLFATLTVLAQSGRQHRPLYQLGGKYSPNGWNFALGGTYMFPNAMQRSDFQLLNTEQGTDTLYAGNFDASGRLGFYLEAGRHHFVEDPIFIHYFDYGIHVKQLRGSENFEGMTRVEDALVPTINNGTFSHIYAGIYGNMNHISQLSDATFLQFSLGANAEYRVLNGMQFDGIVGGIPQEFADPLQVQVHGKIGYGIRLESGRFIIPSIETPILNVQPFYDGKSTLPMFSTRYRPIIFSIRFLFLSYQKVGDCVGKGTEKRGDQLWGKEMRKRYK